jgi:hypothetical protein
MEAVHCRAQVSVSRGPLWGSVATPARWRISRSPRRVRFIAFVDRIRYETGRGTCAPGAPASPAGAVPPSAEPLTSGCVQNPVWAGPGRRFVPVPRMSGIYDSQQGVSRHKQPDELNAVVKSLPPCPCCVCSGQARDEAVRPASGFLSQHPSLACVLFPGLVWGVTALHKNRSYNNYNTYR